MSHAPALLPEIVRRSARLLLASDTSAKGVRVAVATAAVVTLAAGADAAVAPRAAAHTVPASSGVYIRVGGLTYAHGAGTETWGMRTHSAWSSRVVKHRYAVGTVYGYRVSSGDHAKGLAADFMVYSDD